MSRFLLVRRFLLTVKRDGITTALRQTLGYARRHIWGLGPSSIAGVVAETPARSEEYLHGIWRTLAQQDAFHIVQTPSIARKRRHIAMIADLNLPQCRKYRVEQLATFWRARGVGFEYVHYADIPRATQIMQHATHLMEYRLQVSPTAEMLRYEARRLRLPILYDLDDPLFSVSAYENYRNMDALTPAMKAHFVAEAPKYLSMMNGADILSVSTPGMAEHARCYSDRPVFVRRNFADPETLEAGQAAMHSREPADGVFRVAFASGSQGHEVDLSEIIDPLTDFITAHPSRRFLVIGHFDVSCLSDALRRQTELVKFSTYRSYLTTLSRAQVAVMPLCDDTFNRCKSAVRVIDAAAVAVPCVIGRVGDQQEVVRVGETGLVADSSADWMDALQSLAANPSKAQMIGQAARTDLEARWSGSDAAHIIAPELIEWVAA